MKQAPLFRRRFFAQTPLTPVPSAALSTRVEYLRLQGHAVNPGALLSGQTVFLTPGGVLDLVVTPYGGAGLGRLSYPPRLSVGIKRGDEELTYRFQLPRVAVLGERFVVHCYGHDGLPAFAFSLEIGARPA